MMGKHLKYALIAFLLALVQTQVMRLLSLEGITPDLLTIWVVYVALREGQISGTIWGFLAGLFFDLVTGNFIGLGALTKTICGFTAGYFYQENKTEITLGSYRFILIVLITALIDTTIFFVLFTRGTDIGLVRAIFEFGLTTSLYTATITLLPMLVFSRKSV